MNYNNSYNSNSQQGYQQSGQGGYPPQGSNNQGYAYGGQGGMNYGQNPEQQYQGTQQPPIGDAGMQGGQPLQPQYSAYPEYNPQSTVVSGKSYQSHVSGLSGWNDPPPKSDSVDANLDKILGSVNSPQGIIIASLSNALDGARQAFASNPQMKPRIQDIEKRMDGLFDRLASPDINKSALAHLLKVAQALDKMNLAEAHDYAMKLMVANYANETAWIVGVKRLVDLLQRI